MKFLSTLMRRDDESGFSLPELATALIVMALLLGIGIWLILGTRSKNASITARNQIASDLRLCARMAESSKKPWGILFYNHSYANATWHDVYRWMYFDNCDDNESTNPAHWISPPQGATPNDATHQYRVSLMDQAIMTRSPRPAPNYWNGTYIYVRFKPVGSVLYAQYAVWSGGVRDWRNFGASTFIRCADKDGANPVDVMIYPLGDIGVEE